MPKAVKKPRESKDTTSTLYRESPDWDRYKGAISERLEKTSDLSAQPAKENQSR